MNLFSGKEWRGRYREQTVDTIGEGKSGMNGESSIDVYTLSCLRQTANKKLLYNNREPSLVLCDDLKGWDGGRGEERETQEGGTTVQISHGYMADLIAK